MHSLCEKEKSSESGKAVRSTVVAMSDLNIVIQGGSEIN